MKTGTCKHFNGTHHNTHCEAGVCYRDVTTDPDQLEGSGLRIACHSLPWKRSTPSQMEHFNRRGKCNKYEDPTPEEIAADRAVIQAMMDRMMSAGPLISKVKKEHKGQDWKGVEPCPVCAGTLHLSHSAYNGHVWGRCETENCLAWME